MISLFLLFKERKGIKTKDDNADSHRTAFPSFSGYRQKAGSRKKERPRFPELRRSSHREEDGTRKTEREREKGKKERRNVTGIRPKTALFAP